MVRSLVSGGLLVGLGLLACSSGGAPATSSAASDAGARIERPDDRDAGRVADGGEENLAPSQATSAEATIGGVARSLERAQYGETQKDGTLYVEAYEGGEQACPEEKTPKRTLIVSGVPKGDAGATFTGADGVTVTLVDFTGDQIPTTPPSAKATKVTVTIVAVEEHASAELEVDAAFADGTAKGRVYATYCAAMSE